MQTDFHEKAHSVEADVAAMARYVLAATARIGWEVLARHEIPHGVATAMRRRVWLWRVLGDSRKPGPESVAQAPSEARQAGPRVVTEQDRPSGFRTLSLRRGLAPLKDLVDSGLREPQLRGYLALG